MLQAPMTDGSAQASSMSADAAAAQSNGSPTELMEVREVDGGDEDKDLRELLMPDVRSLPLVPPSAVESNFVAYFAPGLARTHVAFRDEGGVTGVDFNVGKSDRSAIKVTGKRKKNAQHFESNTILCKVCTKSDSYVVRCCVKGSLLEVNERLIKQPDLLNSLADREGYIAIIMPKPADWLKVKATLLGLEEYKRLKEQC